MKKFISFLKKTTKKISKEYLVYTGMFLALMIVIYCYVIYANMSNAPTFTYADF